LTPPSRSAPHGTGNLAPGHLGVVKSRLGNHRRAREHLDQALTIGHETGDRSSAAEPRGGSADGVVDDAAVWRSGYWA
jgi:hypothetical protein